MKEYYTAMKMENLPPPHISTKTGRRNPGHRSQEDGSPWGVGPGGRMKGSWGLNISCFLIWVVVTWVCSIYENLSSCTVKIHGCMHVILWPPHAKSWLTGKDPDAGRDWGAGGEGDDRGWDGWMASPTRWKWVWVNSGSWWWTGRPGVLRFMGSQRVRYNGVTELNWSYIRSCTTYDSICRKHTAQVSLETESRPEAVRDWGRGWGVTV